MTDIPKEWSFPDLFYANVDGDPRLLTVRFEKQRLRKESETKQLTASLDDIIAKQRPSVIVFDLGNFGRFSEEVIGIMLRYTKEVERAELHNPPSSLVNKLDTLNIAEFFTISSSEGESDDSP